jgi:AcrR family transcriptional regulator
MTQRTAWDHARKEFQLEPEGSSVQQLSLRARKKAQAKLTLQRAALQLFVDKGFAATTVDEIAAAADFSRSTFFRYFGSKEDVLFGDYDETGERFANLLLARPANESPMKAFQETTIEMAARPEVSENIDIGALRMNLLAADQMLRTRHAEYVTRWESKIAEIVARRAGRTDPTESDRLAATLCISVNNRVSERMLAPGTSEDPVDVVRSEYSLLKGLVSEPAQT